MASARPPEHSLVGRTIHIRGTLEGNEDLTFLGTLEGQLTLNGYHLTVGEEASIRADIRAREVSIAGNVSGKIEPSELLSVRSTGRVVGEVWTPRLAAEEGSNLKGRFVVGLSLDGENASIPDFDGLRRWLELELKGLSEEQLDFSAESPGWARWSIRRQVSHMANSVIMWLVGRWREVLWRDREPDPELVDQVLGTGTSGPSCGCSSAPTT
ncbi:MAG: polymer-forming cytoskeletal protein [Nitrospinota bacterium]